MAAVEHRAIRLLLGALGLAAGRAAVCCPVTRRPDASFGDSPLSVSGSRAPHEFRDACLTGWRIPGAAFRRHRVLPERTFPPRSRDERSSFAGLRAEDPRRARRLRGPPSKSAVVGIREGDAGLGATWGPRRGGAGGGRGRGWRLAVKFWVKFLAVNLR